MMRQGAVQALRNRARGLGLSSLALGLVTIFSYKLHINSPTVLLMCAFTAVLQSLICGFISSINRQRADEQRARLAAIVDSCDDAIFSKNLDGTIMSWSSGAEKLFGYTAEEIIGRPISLLVPPERPDEFRQILERTQSGARLDHHETTRVCRDGSRVEVSVTTSPLRDAAGAVVGSSTIARDIKERRHAEATLQES